MEKTKKPCKRADKKLDDVRKRLEHLLADSPAIFYTCKIGKNWTCTFVGENITRQLGYTPVEFCENAGFWTERIHPDDRQRVSDGLSQLLENGHLVHEYRFIDTNGRHRWVRDESKLTYDTEGHPIDCIGFWLDITDRKSAEEELQRAQARTESVLASVADAHVLFDRQWRYTYVNEAASRAMGRPREKILGRTLWEVFPDIAGTELDRQYHRAMDERAPVVFEFYYPTSDTWWENRFYPAPEGLAVFAADITGRKRAEEALRESEKKFRALFESSHDVIVLLDTLGNIVDVNRGAEQLTGHSQSELRTMNVFQHLIAPEDQPMIRQAIKEAFEGRDRTCQVRWKTKGGDTIYFDGLTAPRRSPNGEVISAFCTLRDITERKRAEEELRKSEDKFKELFNATLDGVYQADATGVFTVMNRAGAAIFGYKGPEEIIGRNILEYWRDPRDRDALISDLKNRKSVSAYPIRARKKTGEPIELESSSSIIEDEKGGFLGIEGILRDVTERKRAEERTYQQLKKLSALRSIDLTTCSGLDVRITLEVFMEQVIAQLGVHAANVLLLNPRTGILEYAASQGFRTSALIHSSLRVGEGCAGVAALEKRLVSIPDLKEGGPGFKRPKVLEGEDFIAYYGVPLVAKGRVKGVLEIFHRSPLHPDKEWFEFLDSLALQAAIAIDNNSLFYSLERSNMDLTVAYDSTIEGWSRALDYRDKETEGHSQRVTAMTLRVAREMGMSEEELVHARRGALLHDIGKMGIPDSILLKPGPLTEEERKIMRLHPVYAYDLLNPIPYLRPALDIPYCHHEKWDGSGYPRELKAEQIPLSARIFAVVDVWEALRSDRPYRPVWSEGKAKDNILSLAGIQFDPRVVQAFISALAERKES